MATGGVERAVTPVLRAVSVPGAHHALLAPKLPGGTLAIRTALRAMARLGTGLGRDADDLVRLIEALPDATARSAFIRTLRGVVDWRGQVVTMGGSCCAGLTVRSRPPSTRRSAWSASAAPPEQPDKSAPPSRGTRGFGYDWPKPHRGDAS